MSRRLLDDLTAFDVVARERSFTRAAAKLGVSQSALSQTVGLLERRLGFLLLTRTTRSVAPTAAGERLIATVGPHLAAIDDALSALGEFRDKPTGTVRITSTQHAAQAVLCPALARVLPRYPDINVEIVVDSGLTDIVASQLDAGVRPGETIDRDMITVPISAELRMAVVGAPAYFRSRTFPATPGDLTQHVCINLRTATNNALYVWEFEHAGIKLRVRVDGQVVLNDASVIVAAATQGIGLAYLAEGQVDDRIRSGALVRVLEDWCPPFGRYYLYYPSRRLPTQAFQIIREALRKEAT